MKEFEKGHKVTDDLLDLYNDVGRIWKDPNYPYGVFNEDMPPQLIIHFYK